MTVREDLLAGDMEPDELEVAILERVSSDRDLRWMIDTASEIWDRLLAVLKAVPRDTLSRAESNAAIGAAINATVTPGEFVFCLTFYRLLGRGGNDWARGAADALNILLGAHLRDEIKTPPDGTSLQWMGRL